MAKMNDKLIDYMVALNANANLLVKHNANPVGAAKDSGLDDEAIDMIMNGRYDDIQARCFNIKAAQSSGGLMISFHSA